MEPERHRSTGGAHAMRRRSRDCSSSGSLTPERENPERPERYGDALATIRAAGGDVLVARSPARSWASARCCSSSTSSTRAARSPRSRASTSTTAAPGPRRRRRAARAQRLSGPRRRAATASSSPRTTCGPTRTGSTTRHGLRPRRTSGSSCADDRDRVGPSATVVAGQRAARPRPPGSPPLASERTDAQRELLERINVGGPMGEANVFTTLVRAPDVFRQWLPFGGALLRARCPRGTASC